VKDLAVRMTVRPGQFVTSQFTRRRQSTTNVPGELSVSPGSSLPADRPPVLLVDPILATRSS
jgi:hypothetical protein